MPWPKLWSSLTKADEAKEPSLKERANEAIKSIADVNPKPDSNQQTAIVNLNAFSEPQTIVATLALTTVTLGFFKFYRNYLRRIPEAININPGYFRRRSLLGKVTSVGDGDNFRIFHTPGGWLAGWGWLPLRRVPTNKKDLKSNTIHVRLAGIDAPELAHFGRPAQPYSQEALDWLTSYVLGRRVRAYVYKADQYSRVVATAYVWKGFLRRDVGLQMIRAGLATVYEAKSGAEFGVGLEQKYRNAEWWAKTKRKGMWAGRRSDFESPREYKTRYGMGSPTEEQNSDKK